MSNVLTTSGANNLVVLVYFDDHQKFSKILPFQVRIMSFHQQIPQFMKLFLMDRMIH